MIEKYGNLWTYEAEARCVTTNGIVNHQGVLVMGKGVAKDASIRYPDLSKILGEYVTRWGNRAFYIKKYSILSFPTKTDWRLPSIPELIVKSAQQVVEIVNKFTISSVALPRPGCGNGGLQWTQVKHLIKSILDDRFIVVSI